MVRLSTNQDFPDMTQTIDQQTGFVCRIWL